MLKIDESNKLLKFKIFDFNPIKNIKNIYKIKNKNDILIYCDLGAKNKIASPMLGKTFYEYFKQIGNNVSIIVGDYSNEINLAPDKINDAVFSLKKDDLLVLVGSGMTLYFHKNKKRIDKNILLKKHGIKMVSTNGLLSLKKNKFNDFLKAFNHDEKELMNLNKKLVKLFKNTKTAYVTCPKGTNISFKFGGRKIISNDGSLKDYSTNYPVGEVYTAPIENSAQGIAYVKSVKVLGETFLLKNSKKMVFEKGLLIDTTVPKLKKGLGELELFNKKKGLVNYKKAPYTIAEFAVGTNKKAKLIGLMINDEKVYGTVHFAIGANTHFGGKTKCNGHMDYVIEKPTLYLDNKKILANGIFLI